MSQDDKTTPDNKTQVNTTEPSSKSSSSKSKPWFDTPAPVKRLFSRFPLQTHAPNHLPVRTAVDRTRNNLYIFTTHEAAGRGAPSFNPSCLKWQAYLKFMGVEYVTVVSNNHASPSGVLPFLLPASTAPRTESVLPIPSNKLQHWVSERSASREESLDMRYGAYMSLLDNRIRNAWLYTLYLTPSNFDSVAKPRYILPSCSNSLVRQTISYQLLQAAATELLKQSSVIDVDSLFRDAEKAWEALSELLGNDEHFFAEETPGLFDASVFAYTHLLMSESMRWQDKRLANTLANHDNLVRHSERISQRYFEGVHPA